MAAVIDHPTLSLLLPSYSAHDPGGWGRLFDLARAADAAGIDRVLLSDHVVFGERMDEYARPEIGGSAGGRQPTGPDGHWLEPLTTLAVLAGMTEHVRLGTNILQAALRRPVVLAKSAATLDVLSSGRLDLGVGVGWQREEYEAAGLPFEGRGRLLDQSLEVCQLLWTERRADFTSPLLSFTAIHQMPKPVQAGGVPVWVSGTLNRAVVRRLARFGIGWIPWGPDAADPTAPGRMRRAIAALGRTDADALQVAGNLPIVTSAGGAIDTSASLSSLPAWLGAGVTDFRFTLPRRSTRHDEQDDLSELVGAFRTVATTTTGICR